MRKGLVKFTDYIFSKRTYNENISTVMWAVVDPDSFDQLQVDHSYVTEPDDVINRAALAWHESEQVDGESGLPPSGGALPRQDTITLFVRGPLVKPVNDGPFYVSDVFIIHGRLIIALAKLQSPITGVVAQVFFDSNADLERRLYEDYSLEAPPPLPSPEDN